MVRWNWNLMNYADGSYLGKMENISQQNLTPAFNAAGAASFQIPLDDDVAYYIDNLSTYIVCERSVNNGPFSTKWEGKVWNTTENAADNKMTVNCLGWWEELNHRMTITDLTFAAMSIGRIAWSLLGHTVSGDGPLGFNVGAAQDAGFVIDSYKIGEDLNIQAEIQKLTTVENGIDFYFDYATRTFMFVDHYGSDKPEAHFGFKKGPMNASNVIRTRDGSRVCTRMKAISPLTHNWVIEDAASIGTRGVYREVQTLTGLRWDTSGTVDQAKAHEAQALSAYAAGETIVRGDPVTTFDVPVLPPGPDNDGFNVEVPMPYDDFDLGDTMRLSCGQGRLSLDNQAIRCYGFSLSIGTEGEERLNSLQLAL